MKKITQSTSSLSEQFSKLAKERDSLINKLSQYENLMTETAEAFLQYAENCDDVIYQISLDLTKTIYVNSAIEKKWGIPRATLQQNPQAWFDAIHPEDKHMVYEAILDMIQNNKKKIWIEYRIKKTNGDIVYVNDNILMIKNTTGLVNCIMGIAMDMTKFIQLKKITLVYDQILYVIESEKSLEITLDIILKICCNSFNWDEGEIWLLDQLSESFYCIKIWHKLADTIKEFYELSIKLKIKADSGFQGEIIRSHHPILVNDFPEHKEYYRGTVAGKINLNCAFGLSIFFQGKVIGVVNFFSREKKVVDQNEIQIMEKISSILGSVIQKKLSDERLNYIISHDYLTGLVNRNGLEFSLSKCIENAKTNVLAIIFIDLDRFKLINETMGFDIGDLLLKTVANKLHDQLSNVIEIIANIGADRFVLVTNSLNSAEQLQPLIDHILAIFSMPFLIKEKEIFLTISIGISIYPFDGLDNISLLKNADVALYQAKRQGGNTVQYCTKTLQKTVANAVNIENGLRHALAENQLKLYYQPKVDLKTGNIIGVEALVRWEDPEYGLRLPGSFMSIAEQSDLIIYLGEWVLLEICYHFPLLANQIPVAINLSARQLKEQYDIVNFIANLITKLTIPPRLLEIEVTESMMISNVRRSLEVLNELKKIGFSIAIDDFGTGYSSFGYLKQFKPDKIKIDKSFIDELPNDQSARAIVRAIIALSKALDMRVIAEGVENQEQLKILKAEGCDEIQGFYFAKPMPLYELNELIINKTKLKFPT